MNTNMTKWQLVEMLGATLTIDPSSPSKFDATLAFGLKRHHLRSDLHSDPYAHAADLVIKMIHSSMRPRT